MNRSVLLIDDSPTVCTDIRNALTTAGVAVTCCSTLAEARGYLQRAWFSVVVLDVNLPDGNGIALLSELSRDARLCRLPVVLLSTESGAHTRVRGMIRGAVEYIGKPYDRAYLVERIRELSRHADGIARAPRWLGDQRVLLIDSRTRPHDALAHHLRCDGHSVVVARSVEEALDFLNVEPFECIVFELDTDSSGGVDACQRIRESRHGSRAHMLLLTTRDDAGARRAARDGGADDLVLSTATFGLLRIRLRAHLRKVRRASTPPPPSSL